MAIDLEQARALARGENPSRVYELIESEKIPAEIAAAYHATSKALYWKDKDLARSRAVLERGIAYALDPSRKDDQETRGKGKAMCFDLASFCWPGWDEPGITITEEDVAAGERAADDNLRLAIELQRGPGPMGNAHFMVGAYHLTRNRRESAVESFQAFHRFAVENGDADSDLLAEGYSALAAGDKPAFAAVESRLRARQSENGDFFADQLVTAARVYPFETMDREPRDFEASSAE